MPCRPFRADVPTELGTAVVTGSDSRGNVCHFTTPIVVHGRIVVVGDTQLYALNP
jgi:hypothetical protein